MEETYPKPISHFNMLQKGKWVGVIRVPFGARMGKGINGRYRDYILIMSAENASHSTTQVRS